VHAALLLCCFSCSAPTAPAKRHRLPSLRTCRPSLVSLVGARVKVFWFHMPQVQVTWKLRSSNCRQNPSSATLFIHSYRSFLPFFGQFPFSHFVLFAADTYRAAAGKQVQSCVRQLHSIHERLFSQISALAATSNVPVFKVAKNTFFSSSFLLHSLAIIAFTHTHPDRECRHRQTKRAGCRKVRRD
jgi:hypothetical protein